MDILMLKSLCFYLFGDEWMNSPLCECSEVTVGSVTVFCAQLGGLFRILTSTVKENGDIFTF